MALELAQRITTARQSQAPGNGTSSGATIHKIQSGNTTVDVGGDYGYTLPNLELMVPVLHDNSDVEVEDDTLKIRDEALFQAVKTAVEPWDDYLESDEGVRQLQAGAEGDGAVEDIAENIADDVGEDIAEDVIEDVTQGQSLDEVAESRGMSRGQLIAQLEAAGFDVTTIKPSSDNGDVEGVEIRQTPADEGAESGKLIVGSYDDHHHDARTIRYTDADGNKIRRVEYADGEISESVTDTEGTETTTVTKPDGTVVETVIEPNGRQTKTTTEPPEDGKLITHDVKPGESLSEIAGQYEGVEGWQDLEPDNRNFFSGRDPNLIRPGEEITIGGGRSTVEVTNNGYTLTTKPDGEMTLTDDAGDVELQIETGTPGEGLVQTLLALDLDDSNPQQEREAEVVKTAIEAYLAREHQATAAQTAQDSQEAKRAAMEEYGQGRPATPSIEKDEQGNEVVNLYGNPPPGKAPSGGSWVLMNGTWMDPKVAEATIAENIALIELAEAQTNAEQNEATLDIYALNSDYGQSIDNAKRTLNEALLPYGLSWVKPNPQETLADTRNRRDNANTRLESLGDIKDEYEQVQDLLEDAEQLKLPEQKLPRPPLAAGHHPFSFTRDDLEGDLEDAQDGAAHSEVMALFSNITVHMTRGNKKFADYRLDILRQEKSNTEPESDRYKKLEKEIAETETYRDSAAEGLELAEAHSEFLTAGAKARKYDAQAIDLKQRIFEQYVSENLDFIKFDDPEYDEYRRGGGDPLGKLVKVEVVEREEEGHQLWLVMTFEHGTDERQLTFDPDVGGVDIDVGEERINDPLNQAWQELLAGEKNSCNNHELGASDNSWIGASENELSAGERFHRILAEQATTKEDLITEVDNLEEKLADLLQPADSSQPKMLDKAFPENIKPVEITIEGQDVQVAPEVAANYEQYGMDALINSDLPVRIQVENDDKEPEWRWVDPEVVSTQAALDTARDHFDERLDKAENFRNTVEAAADKFEFYQTQPLKLMEDSESTQHSADLDNTYLDEHRDQALDAYELQFQAFFDKGYNGKFRSVTEHQLEAVVTQEFGINSSPRSVIQEVQRLGGDTPDISVVKFFYLDPHLGEQQHSLIAVKDSAEKTYYVDAMGMKFSSLDDFQDNNRQFSENGRLVVPRNLEMKPDENGRIPLDVVKARNVSITEKVTDRAVMAATTVATATSFFVPGAAPIAVLGSAYLIGRSGYQLDNYMAHGGEREDSESQDHILGMITNTLPMVSNAARTIGMYRAYRAAEVPMSMGTALRASMGGVRTKSATFNLGFRRFDFEASPHAGNINTYYTSSSLSNLFARETDKWAIGVGTLLMARELDRLVAHGYQMSSVDLWNAWSGLGIGFAGTFLGIRGHWMTRPNQLSSQNGPHSGPRTDNETQGSPNDPTGNGPNEGPDAGMVVYEVGADGVYRPTDERAYHDPSKPVIRHEDIPDSDVSQAARTTQDIAAQPARDHQELEIYHPSHPTRSQSSSPEISESAAISHNGSSPRHSYRTIQVGGEPVEVKFLSGQPPKGDENVYVLQEGGPRVSAEELVATGKTHIIKFNPNTQAWEGVPLVLGASEDHVVNEYSKKTLQQENSKIAISSQGVTRRSESSPLGFQPLQRVTREKVEIGTRDQLLSSGLPVIEDPAGILYLPQTGKPVPGPDVAIKNQSKTATTHPFREPIASSPEQKGAFHTAYPLKKSDYPLKEWMAIYTPENGLFYTEARQTDTQWVYRPNHERRAATNAVMIRPDIHVISALGTRDTLFDLQGNAITTISDLRRRPLTPQRLANRLSENFGLDEKAYTPGQPVALLAEYTGAEGRKSFAQQLANELHAPVYGLQGSFEKRQWLLFFPDRLSQPVLQPDFETPHISSQGEQAVRIKWNLLEKRNSAELEVLSHDDPVKIDTFLAPQDSFVINAHAQELFQRGPENIATLARETGYNGDSVAVLLTLSPTEETRQFARDLAEKLSGPVLVMTDKAWRPGGHAIDKNTVSVSRVEGAANRRIELDAKGRIGFLDTQENQKSMLWLNFGPLERSYKYFERKQGQMDDVRLNIFEVPKSTLEEIRRNSVRQSQANEEGNTDKPVLGDWHESPDQFGLRWEQAKHLESLIIPESVKIVTSSHENSGKEYLASRPHPKLDEFGREIIIKSPTHASSPETWNSSSQVATFIPGGVDPDLLNGIAMEAWKAPTTIEGWRKVPGLNPKLHEPEAHPGIKKAGVVIVEPDGRIWIIESTNHFAGSRTFPKGTVDEGLSLQATAIKEAYEETGLHVELLHHLIDDKPKESKTTTRYYVARRLAGTPSEMGWESQGIYLVPHEQMMGTLGTRRDRRIFSVLSRSGHDLSSYPLKNEGLNQGKDEGLDVLDLGANQPAASEFDTIRLSDETGKFIEARVLGHPPESAENIYIRPAIGPHPRGDESGVKHKTHILHQGPDNEAFVMPWIRGASEPSRPKRPQSDDSLPSPTEALRGRDSADGSVASKFIYRLDSRNPETVFQEGFLPRFGAWTNKYSDLKEAVTAHLWAEDSVFVSTSRELQIAKGAGEENEWIYVIVDPETGIVVDKLLGSHDWEGASEVVYDAIPSEYIVGARQLGENKKLRPRNKQDGVISEPTWANVFTDGFVRNPNFDPSLWPNSRIDSERRTTLHDQGPTADRVVRHTDDLGAISPFGSDATSGRPAVNKSSPDYRPEALRARLPRAIEEAFSPTPDHDEPTVIFRGDTRTPEDIFSNGFNEEGQPFPSGVISTSLSAREAKGFAKGEDEEGNLDGTGGWLYTIIEDVSDGDIVYSLPVQGRFPSDRDHYEVPFPSEVPPENILAARQVDFDGRLFGPVVYNPNFKDPSRLPDEVGRDGGDGSPRSLSAAYHPASDSNARSNEPAATAFTRPSLPEPTPSFQLPHIIADVAPPQPARVTLSAEYTPLPPIKYFIDGNEISLDHSDSTVPLVHVTQYVAPATTARKAAASEQPNQPGRDTPPPTTQVSLKSPTTTEDVGRNYGGIRRRLHETWNRTRRGDDLERSWSPGQYAREMMDKSPTLRRLYEEAVHQHGVNIRLGPEGDGTYYTPYYSEILIDRALATQSDVLLISLAHELSHAVSHQRGSVSSARPGTLLTATPGRLLPVLRLQDGNGVVRGREDMHSEAVETTVAAHLQDEGAAVLTALQVRDEWLRAGETLADDVTDPTVTWDTHVSRIYKDYRDGRLSWQEATVNLGKIIEDLPTSDKESVSYGYDYRQQEHDYYDAKEAERWQAGVSSSPQSGSRPGGPSTFMAARSPGAQPTGPERGSASPTPQAKVVHTSAPPEGQPRLYRIDDLDALRQAVSSGEIPVGNYLHVIRTQRTTDTFTLNDGKVPYSGRIQDDGQIRWPAGRTGHVDDISVTTPNTEGRQVVQVRSEGADGQRTHYVRSNDDVYIVVTELSAKQVRERLRSGSGLSFAEYSGMGAWNVPGALPVTQQVSVFTPKPFKPLDSTLPQSQKNVLGNPKTGNVTSLPPKRDGSQNAIRAVLMGVGGIGAYFSLAAPPHISMPLNALATAVRGASLGIRSLAPDETAVDTVRGRVHRGIEFVTLAINNPNSASQLTEMGNIVDTSSSALFVGGNTLYLYKTYRESVTGQPFMPWADDFALPMFGIGSGLYTASSGVDLLNNGGLMAAGHTTAGTLFTAGSTLLWFRDSHIGKKVRPFKSSEPAQSSESSPKKRDIITFTTFGPGLIGGGLLAASSLFDDEEEKPSDDTTPTPPNTDEPLPGKPDDSNRDEPTPPENEEPQPDSPDDAVEDGETDDDGRFNPGLKDSADYEEIIVQPGQTMGGIVLRHGHDIAEVVELNMGHIPNPSVLYPGDRIYLPR
ncbi:scabin-related ADP-ribosyltransferase [Litchfieldella anticariensis]|nr:NUDIX domain-containing protein [Halomonas anticariensis]